MSPVTRMQPWYTSFHFIFSVYAAAASFWKGTPTGSWSCLLTRFSWTISLSVPTSNYTQRLIRVELRIAHIHVLHTYNFSLASLSDHVFGNLFLRRMRTPSSATTRSRTRSFPSSGSRLLALLYWRGDPETKRRGWWWRELRPSLQSLLLSSHVLTSAKPGRSLASFHLHIYHCYISSAVGWLLLGK